MAAGVEGDVMAGNGAAAAAEVVGGVGGGRTTAELAATIADDDDDDVEEAKCVLGEAMVACEGGAANRLAARFRSSSRAAAFVALLAWASCSLAALI